MSQKDFRGLLFKDKFLNGAGATVKSLQLRYEKGVLETTDVKDQIGLGREPVFEAEGE